MSANPLGPQSDVLKSLNASFVAIGSAASSARGIPRSTDDIDLIAQIGAFQAQGLAAAVGRDWYCEPDQIREALQRGRSFNVIHIPTAWKIDLSPAQTEFHESELRRSTEEAVTLDGEAYRCPVSTPEDVVIAKLCCCYKDGRQVSERQWRDIGGVIAINQNLDFEYLRLWAVRLGVSDLLEQALTLPPEQ